MVQNLQLYRLPVPWGIDPPNSKNNWPAALPALPQPRSHEPRLGVAPGRRRPGSRQPPPVAHRPQVEQRLLPSSVINDEVSGAAEAVEAQQGYCPAASSCGTARGRSPRNSCRGLSPSAAPPRSGSTPPGRLVLRRRRQPRQGRRGHRTPALVLDEFPPATPPPSSPPTSAMADWLAGGEGRPASPLTATANEGGGRRKAAVRYVRHPLEGDEVKSHLAGGKLPTRLALTWNDRISFILTEKLEIKRLTFLDLVKEEAEQSAEHADEQFDADFAPDDRRTRPLPAPAVDALGGEVAEAAVSPANTAAGTPPGKREARGDCCPCGSGPPLRRLLRPPATPAPRPPPPRPSCARATAPTFSASSLPPRHLAPLTRPDRLGLGEDGPCRWLGAGGAPPRNVRRRPGRGRIRRPLPGRRPGANGCSNSAISGGRWPLVLRRRFVPGPEK